MTVNRQLIVCLLLVIALFAVYGQVIHFDFVHYDDPDYVVLNTPIHQGFTVDSVCWAFTTVWAANWHPVTWLSHILDCQLFGLNPAGHHLTNLIIHTLNSVILFLLLCRLTDRWRPSTVVAALFALHPLHVESVAWISERKDLLCTFFGLAAVAFYLRYVRHRRGATRDYMLVLLCYALCLMAKPMLVTLAPLLLLLDYWPLNRVNFHPRSPLRGAHWQVNNHLIIEKVPLLALAAASSVITLFAQSAGQATRAAAHVGFTDRAANGLVACARYLLKLLWPSNLAVHYPHPNLPGGEPWAAWQVLGAAVLLALITAAVLRFRAARYLPVGWFWFLIALIPVIGVIQVGEAAYSDRYTYIPSIGVFILIAFGGAALLHWLEEEVFLSPAPRATGAAVAVFMILAFSCATAWYTSFWRNSTALFQRTLAVSPHSPVMHNNMGVVLYERGDADGAAGHYRAAIALHPDYHLPHHNLGNLHFIAGRLDEAADAYKKALRTHPDYLPSRISLANVREAQGDFERAIAHYRIALDRRPDLTPLHNMLAAALARAGRTDESLRHFHVAIRHTPEFAVTLNDVARERLPVAPADALKLALAGLSMTDRCHDELKQVVTRAQAAMDRAATAPPASTPY